MNSVETFKVTLTVIEPAEIVGFFEGESVEQVTEALTPKLVERWGEGNFGILEIVPADEDEKEFLAAAIAEHKKELN